MDHVTAIDPSWPEGDVYLLAKLLAKLQGGIIVIGQGIYFADCGAFERFGDPNQAEDPKVFRTAKTAARNLARLSDEYPGIELRLALWVHPDMLDSVPLHKYLNISGGRFPTSPSQ